MASSNYKLLQQTERQITQKHIASSAKPLGIKINNESPTLIMFDDNSLSEGSCLRCADTPCMKYEKSDEISKLQSFPADTSDSICPTSAITWPYEKPSPVIDGDSCITCGLCLQRCPSVAIYIDSNDRARINDDTNKIFQLNDEPQDRLKTESSIKLLQKLDRVSPLSLDLEKYLAVLKMAISDGSSVLIGNNPNLVIRNMLKGIGLKAATRRPGDNNLRSDILFEDNSDLLGIGEIEFGLDMLNPPRNILDSIAVFQSRYSIKNIASFIFPLSLPNQRSEIWQVLKDIKDVLHIQIAVIPIGILLLLFWSQIRMSVKELSSFYIDIDNLSHLKTLNHYLKSKSVSVPELPGVTIPQK